MGISAFAKRRPIVTCYGLVFAISWGLGLIVLSPDTFVRQQADLASAVAPPLCCSARRPERRRLTVRRPGARPGGDAGPSVAIAYVAS